LAPDRREVARGITHYSAEDLLAIRGKRSDEIAALMDAEYGPIVVHRDDMVVTSQ
jgi:glutamate 5-kinase